ncbi:MAG: hypothetical protein IIC36_00710 [Gemmatimonadetes bacterium]|nr:hypothetical protein [Gemmatimonadota bacterium]
MSAVFLDSAARDSSRSGPEFVDDPRGGFVLALVVLLLFGIGVAGAAGYQVVLSEALLSVHAKETQTALSIARAGLRSYIGKQIGIHDDTVIYSIEGGDAVVTARLVSVIDDFQTLYLLESEGVYTDPTFTGSPARRTVFQYAVKREVALNHVAMMTQVTGDLYVEGNAHIDGNDGASSGTCQQSSVDLTAVIMGSGSFNKEEDPIDGPNPEVIYVGSAAALDSIGIDWDVLTDTAFPVDYEDTWPSCALPADSFTVTRFNGNLSAPSSVCGQGVLIVTGDFTGGDGFQWDGILLAGHIVTTNNNYRIDGLVVGGLDGNGTLTRLDDNTHIDYHRCYAFQAGKRLSHFEMVGSTWWEEM